MKESKIILYVFCFCIYFSGCKSRMSPDEYVSWIRDYKNGLHKERTVINYNFDLQYRPLELLALRDKVKTEDELNKSIKEQGDFYYFTLKLNRLGKSEYSNAEKGEMQYYFSFGLKDDVYLETGEKKIPCTLFHFERSYNLGNTKTFVLGFKREIPLNKDFSFIIDSRFLKTGKVKIHFDHKDFENIPQIKL